MKFDKRLASREGSIEHLEWLKNFYLKKIKQAKNKEELAGEIAGKISSLEQEAIRDRLTGAFNRGFVGAMLGREIELERERGYGLGVMMIDIDFFKSINDEEPDGHAAGDRTLIEIVKLLQEVAGKHAVVGRWGGEEFLVVLPTVSEDSLFEVAVDIGQSVAGWLAGRAKLVRPKLTVSMGVRLTNEGETETSVVGSTDQLLYKAKESGRARMVMIKEGKEVVVKFE